MINYDVMGRIQQCLILKIRIKIVLYHFSDYQKIIPKFGIIFSGYQKTIILLFIPVNNKEFTE